MGGAVVLAAAMSNCGGSGGERTGGAGNTGQGGSGGSTGAGGMGNTGGRFVCPTDQTLDCSGAPQTLADGHVTNLSMREWSVTDGKYCNASGLRGSVFSYSGPAPEDGGVATVDQRSRRRRARRKFPAHADGRPRRLCRRRHLVRPLRQRIVVQRAPVLRVGVRAAHLTGCTFHAYLQTFEQRPASQAPPGGCTAATCYAFPASPDLAPLSMTPTTITVPFTMTSRPAHPYQPDPGSDRRAAVAARIRPGARGRRRSAAPAPSRSASTTSPSSRSNDELRGGLVAAVEPAVAVLVDAVVADLGGAGVEGG